MPSSLDDVGDLPWDPLWEYILGDDDDTIESERGPFSWGLKRRGGGDEDSSFLDYLGSYDSETDRKSRRKSRPNSKEKRDDTLGASSSSLSNSFLSSQPEDKSSSKSSRKGFWSRGPDSSRNEDQESWSLGLDPDIFGQPDPETVDKRQGVKPKKSSTRAVRQGNSEESIIPTRSRVQMGKINEAKQVTEPKVTRKPFWRRSKKTTKDDEKPTLSKEDRDQQKMKRRGLVLFARSRQARKQESREADEQPPETGFNIFRRTEGAREQADEREGDTDEWQFDLIGGSKEADANQNSHSSLFGKREGSKPEESSPDREVVEVIDVKETAGQARTSFFMKRGGNKPNTRSAKSSSTSGSVNDSQNSSIFDWAKFDASTISDEQSSRHEKGRKSPQRRFFGSYNQRDSVGDPSIDSSLSSKFGLGGLMAWVQESDESSSSDSSTVSDTESSDLLVTEDNTSTEQIPVRNKVVDSKVKATKQAVNEIRLHHQPRRDEVEDLRPLSTLPAISEVRSEDSPRVRQEGSAFVRVEQGQNQTLRVLNLQDPPEQVPPPSDDFKTRAQALASRNTRKRSNKKQNGSVRRGCRSVKDLSEEEQQLCKDSGIPIHELSFQELSEIFPKVRSVSDEHRSISSSSVLGTSHSFKSDCPAYLQASPDYFGPQSLYEYEYETGIHMYACYDSFGPPDRTAIKIVSAQMPARKSANKNGTFGEVLVQVEASTVSATDCRIRRGNWWRDLEVRLPINPGVDIVGKLFSIDEDSSKRYGLSKGDRVISLVKCGGNARYISLDPSNLVKVPESIDPAVAVCLAETYLSAFQALHYLQDDDKRYLATALQGQSILIAGKAISNMGRAIAQLAFDAGADNVYALSKPGQYKTLTEMEISPLDEDTYEWWDSLQGKVDCILSLEEDVRPSFYQLLKPTGQAINIRHTRSGVAGKKTTSDSTVPDLTTSIRCKKWRQTSSTYDYDVYDEWETDMDLCKLDLVHLIELLQHNIVAPSVYDRVPLSGVERAQCLVESEDVSGFIVCEPWLVAKSRAIRL